jgi:hypothetical protein
MFFVQVVLIVISNYFHCYFLVELIILREVNSFANVSVMIIIRLVLQQIPQK